MFERLYKAVKNTTLRFTPIRHDYLIKSGFEVFNEKLWYQLADLHIYVKNKHFYYWTPSAKVRRIKNMRQVAKLVYGETDYLR